jgi:hypothetical protein
MLVIIFVSYVVYVSDFPLVIMVDSVSMGSKLMIDNKCY